MFYLDTINQLSFLITACFSFFLFMLSLFINKDYPMAKVIGACFFIPLFLSAASFLSANTTTAEALLMLSRQLLLTALFFILLSKPAANNTSGILLLLFVLPAAMLFAVSNIKFLTQYASLPGAGTIYCALMAALNMYILRKDKGNRSYIFWAMFTFLLGSAVKILELSLIPNHQSIHYLQVILQSAAYLLFTAYLYKEFLENLLKRLQEAEKKLSSVDKSLNVEVRKRVIEIERSNEKLINISKTDSLTQTLNKGAILEEIEKQISAKNVREFSILMFDIDNFKIINDTLGHIAGDKCIKKLAGIAKISVREIDRIGRYGGDEFIIVLPGTNPVYAKLIAERFRKKVAETDTPHFTVSIGIASFPTDGNSVKELVSAADEGLYQSKQKGRNAVSHKNLF